MGDVLLYAKELKNDMETKRAFYDAHVRGDAEPKNAMHNQCMGQTANELKMHVDAFLEQLTVLTGKADDKNWNEHPRLPLILRHNEFVRTTFEKVKLRVNPMVG